jgi:imidazolonepropionase-like amidohydrolase
VNGPQIRTTGEGLVPPDALPPDVVLAVLGAVKTPLPEITDPASAMTESQKLIERGVDGIKMFVSSQRSDALAESAMRAAVQQAHRAGKPVFVHPSTATDIAAAVRAGADIIAHTTPGSGAWDDALLTAMREANVALTPTLTLWKHAMRHDRISVQNRYVDTAVAQLRAWQECGGTILFGTDYGAVDGDPHTEYALMAQAGMNCAQILASLTTAPADRFGARDRSGRIAAGLQADLAVLEGDPEQDAAALARVRYTIRRGQLVYQASEGRTA